MLSVGLFADLTSTHEVVWYDPDGFDGAGACYWNGKVFTRQEYTRRYGPLGRIDVIYFNGNGDEPTAPAGRERPGKGYKMIQNVTKNKKY